MLEPHLAADASESPSNENVTNVVTSEKVHFSKNDVETPTGADVSNSDVLQNERDIVTHIISVDDDPSLNPWTFRSFFIGLGLSTFGGVLGKR